MRFYTSYTPRHWEIGIGFYSAAFYENRYTKVITKHPSELSFLLGPYSICFQFGSKIEIVENN